MQAEFFGYLNAYSFSLAKTNVLRFFHSCYIILLWVVIGGTISSHRLSLAGKREPTHKLLNPTWPRVGFIIWARGRSHDEGS